MTRLDTIIEAYIPNPRVLGTYDITTAQNDERKQDTGLDTYMYVHVYIVTVKSRLLGRTRFHHLLLGFTVCTR